MCLPSCIIQVSETAFLGPVSLAMCLLPPNTTTSQSVGHDVG